MGQLADKLRAVRAASARGFDRLFMFDGLAAESIASAVAALEERIVELEAHAAETDSRNESLAAINARVEQENDLLEAVAEAARRRRDCSHWQDDEDAERASRDALEALDAWRKSQEVPHG